MIVPHFNRRDLEVLGIFIQMILCSAYKISKITNIPSASIWRILVRFSTLGLIIKEERGFKVTPRGLVIAYLLIDKDYIRDKVAERLKEEWKYKGDKEELKGFLNSLQAFLEKNNISPFSLCYSEPLHLAILMNMTNFDDENINKVLGRSLLEWFPTVTTSNGCKAILSYNSEGEVYGLAVDCKISGIKVFHKCPLLGEEVKRLNAR